jgi:hypothetical protein
MIYRLVRWNTEYKDSVMGGSLDNAFAPCSLREWTKTLNVQTEHRSNLDQAFECVCCSSGQECLLFVSVMCCRDNLPDPPCRQHFINKSSVRERKNRIVRVKSLTCPRRREVSNRTECKYNPERSETTEVNLSVLLYQYQTNTRSDEFLWQHVRFEGFTVVTMKNADFWDIASCRSCVNRRFGGTYRLHLHGRKMRKRGSRVSRWLQHWILSTRCVCVSYGL